MSNNPQQFVKQPIPVWAIRYTGKNTGAVKSFCFSLEQQSTAEHDLPGGINWFVKRRGDGKTETIWKKLIAQPEWSDDITAAVYDYIHETYVGVKDGQWIMCGSRSEFYPCESNPEGTAPLNYDLHEG